MKKPNKKWNYFRLITLPKITGWISGRFIYEFILDFVHNKKGKSPFWKDAGWCGKKYCRVCGGKSNPNNKE